MIDGVQLDVEGDDPLAGYISSDIMETVDCTKIAEFVRANNGEADQDLVDFFLLTYVDCKDDPFPVSGDMAQRWIGFTRKDNFKRFAMNVKLADGVDFVISFVGWILWIRVPCFRGISGSS